MSEPRLLGPTLLAKPLDEQETHAGLIVIGKVPNETVRGMIVTVGPGYYRPDGGDPIPMTVQRGDEILFFEDDSNVVTLELDGETLYLMPEHNVLMILSSVGEPISVEP
jgi:co-chaperonin GroES (HSP10)